MKVITADLPETHKEISILTLADFHLGDPHSNYKRLQEYLDFVQSRDNCYVILNGDLMDSATRHSIGDIYSATLQPMEQLKQCVKLFEPIKDRIIAVLPGNHELRIFRQDGIDTTAMMCAQLGLDCYAPTGAFIYVRFGRLSAHKHNRKVCYTIYATHGSGAGRTEGAKIKRLSDLAAICDADVYIHSHTHLPAVFKTVYFRPDPTKNSVYEVSRLFVNTGAALDYGGYGEALGFKPASTETPLIKLCGTQKRAAAVL